MRDSGSGGKCPPGAGGPHSEVSSMLTTCSLRMCMDMGHLCSWMETSVLLGPLREGRALPRGSLGPMFLRAQDALWSSRLGGPQAPRCSSCRAQVQKPMSANRVRHQGHGPGSSVSCTNLPGVPETRRGFPRPGVGSHSSPCPRQPRRC